MSSLQIRLYYAAFVLSVFAIVAGVASHMGDYDAVPTILASGVATCGAIFIGMSLIMRDR
jgi:hypothetical protein